MTRTNSAIGWAALTVAALMAPACSDHPGNQPPPSGDPNTPPSSSDNDGSSYGEASVAPDAGPPFCNAPLDADAGPMSLDDLPLASWCQAPAGLVSEWSSPCGGYLAVSVAVGVDCDREYVFDAASRRLVAVTSGCNGREACVDGDPSFVPPQDPTADPSDVNCLSGRIGFSLCSDAGPPSSN